MGGWKSMTVALTTPTEKLIWVNCYRCLNNYIVIISRSKRSIRVRDMP